MMEQEMRTQLEELVRENPEKLHKIAKVASFLQTLSQPEVTEIAIATVTRLILEGEIKKEEDGSITLSYEDIEKTLNSSTGLKMKKSWSGITLRAATEEETKTARQQRELKGIFRI